MKIKKDKQLTKQATTFKKKLLKLVDTAKSGKSVSNQKYFTNIGDIADLINVCKLIEKGEIKKASKKIDTMNVFCSELLPSNIATKLGKIKVEIYE